jgi:hypothetical protein
MSDPNSAPARHRIVRFIPAFSMLLLLNGGPHNEPLDSQIQREVYAQEESGGSASEQPFEHRDRTELEVSWNGLVSLRGNFGGIDLGILEGKNAKKINEIEEEFYDYQEEIGDDRNYTGVSFRKIYQTNGEYSCRSIYVSPVREYEDTANEVEAEGPLLDPQICSTIWSIVVRDSRLFDPSFDILPTHDFAPMGPLQA